MKEAKEYGSILVVPSLNFDGLRQYAKNKIAGIDQFDLESNVLQEQLPQVLMLIDTAEALVEKYHVVVTNPPYMGASNMDATLSIFVKKYYPDSKSDMSTVCMEKTIKMCAPNGYMAMINIPVWMFLSSYEKLRINLFQNNTLVNMVHPGRGIFGSDFGTTTFVFRKGQVDGYQGSYRRLFDQQGEVKSPEEREQAMLSGKGCYTAQQSNFAKIPGSPVAYWVKTAFYNLFLNMKVEDVGETSKGIITGDNKTFLRLWFEASIEKISFHTRNYCECEKESTKWYPCNKASCIIQSVEGVD